MSDEVDDLLRRAMTALDHQVPDGYFDTLASRTVLRLDDREPSIDRGEGAPRLPGPRESLRDDPAIGDLRDEGERPAASSPGLAAVALPELAKLSVVPALEGIDELARERAARDARAAHANRMNGPATASPAADQAVSMPGRRARSNRRPILAVVGIGLAAAAGAMVFVSTRDKAVRREEVAARAVSGSEAVAPKPSPAGTVATNSTPAGAGSRDTPLETTTASAAGSAAATPEPVPLAASAGSAAQGDPTAKITVDGLARGTKPVVPSASQDAASVPADKQPPVTKGGGKAAYRPNKLQGSTLDDALPDGGPGPGRLRETQPPIGKPAGQGTGEPPFGNDKAGKSQLARQVLSQGDFKRGMTAVAARAKACFAGTQGAAAVELTVAPSGQVQKVTVTGVFAGTPAGTCVERAVKTATFPPWDGGPQSFRYDYLLSE